MAIVACEKRDFFKSLSLFSKTIVRQSRSFTLKRNISNIYKLKEKVQKNTQLSFWWKAKSSTYEICLQGLQSTLLCSAANTVGTSLEYAAFGSGPDAKYIRASAFCFSLSTTMVFAVVRRPHFPRKNTRVFISIDKQPDKYEN